MNFTTINFHRISPFRQSSQSKPPHIKMIEQTSIRFVIPSGESKQNIIVNIPKNTIITDASCLPILSIA